MDYKKILEDGKKLGFSDLEFQISSSTSLSIDVFKGKVEKNQVQSDFSIVLSGLYNDQLASVSTTNQDFDPKKLLKKLKENTKALNKAEKEEIFGGSKEYPKSIVREVDFNNVDNKEKVEFLINLEKKVYELDKRVILVENSCYFESTTTQEIINSKGLNLKKELKSCGAYTYVNASEGESTQTGFGVQVAFNFKDLDLNKIASKAVERATRLLGAKPIKSGKYPVIIEKDAFSSLLGAFLGIFSGEAAIKKTTLLLGKEKTKIFDERVNIIEDPLMENSVYYTPFDDEGVATKKKHLIKDGVFQGFAHNLKTAKALNEELTGNGYNKSVDFAYTYLGNGDTALADLIKSIDKGLLITSMQGLHSGLNPISGDFSLQSSGFYLEDGKISKPTSLIVTSGNFFEMMNDIDKIGNDLELRNESSVNAPSVKFNGLQVSGE
ncbi:MAG TPA: TldD/PmbA family protein [Acholeplasma sp.]|jgi:PmbA protein|nr:TldD/PmbA family protein [Acholeplasma sp.]